MKSVTAVALAALLLLPTVVHAEPTAIIDAQVSSAKIVGDASVTGELVVIESILGANSGTIANLTSPETPRTPPSRIALTGKSIQASTDVLRTSTGAIATPPTSTSSHEDHEYGIETLLWAETFRHNSYVFLVPRGPGSATIHLDAGETAVRPTQEYPGAAEEWVAPDASRLPLESSSSRDAVRLQAADWRSLRVAGDFAITLWDIDVQAAGPHWGDDLRSGYFFDSAVPAETGLDLVGNSESRQLYLYVTEGVLELSFDADATLAVIADLQDASGQESVTFYDAAGQVNLPGGPQEVSRRDVSFTGAFDVSFRQVKEGRLDVAATGEPTRAIVGGKEYLYAPATQAISSPAMFAWWGLAVVAAVAIVGAVALRRRAQAGAFERVERLMDEGEYGRAVAAAKPSLVQSRRYSSDVQVMRTVSLLRLGRHEEARATLDGWRGVQGATVDYLWAFLHAATGDAAAAKRRIAECLAKEPGMQADIDANPVFAGVLNPRAQTRKAALPREGYT